MAAIMVFFRSQNGPRYSKEMTPSCKHATPQTLEIPNFHLPTIAGQTLSQPALVGEDADGSDFRFRFATDESVTVLSAFNDALVQFGYRCVVGNSPRSRCCIGTNC